MENFLGGIVTHQGASRSLSVLRALSIISLALGLKTAKYNLLLSASVLAQHLPNRPIGSRRQFGGRPVDLILYYLA